MVRLFEKKLLNWKESGMKKPLEDGIIPVDVKTGTNVKSSSLNSYMRENKPKYGIRISAKNFGFENDIKSLPLYAAFLI